MMMVTTAATMFQVARRPRNCIPYRFCWGWLVLLIITATTPCVFGFASPTPKKTKDPVDGLISTVKSGQKFVSKLQNQIISQKKQSNGPQDFLSQLNLQSSTEPKTFGFLARQIPDLLTASFPVSIVFS
jgi:hypothetical protein